MNERTARIFAVAAAVSAIAAAGYYAVAGLLTPDAVVPGSDVYPARVFAGYVAVRSFVLLGALAVFASMRNWKLLQVALVLNAIVQAGDVVLGVLQHDHMKTFDPAFLLLFCAAWALRERPAASA
jgi:hypothetical protein